MIYFFIGFMFLMTLLINISLALTPRISRRSNLFGLTIPSDLQNSEEVTRLVYFFTKTLLSLNIPLSLPFILALLMKDVEKTTDFLSIYLLGAMLINFLAFLILYFDTRRKLARFLLDTPSKINRSKQKITVDLSFRSNPFILPNWIFVLLNGIFILFSLVYTFLIYPKIPQEIPTNFDAMMQPTSFSSKSLFTVLFAPIFQVFLLVVFTVTNEALFKAKQESVLKDSEIYNQNDRQFRKATSISLLFTSILMQTLFTFIQWMTITPNTNYSLFLPLIVLTLVSIVGINLFIGFKYRQSGEGLTPEVNFDTRTDDDIWKFGVFYYNPQDPSIWVMKKTGMGLTTNFARWESWLLIIGLLLIPIVMALFFK